MPAAAPAPSAAQFLRGYVGRLLSWGHCMAIQRRKKRPYDSVSYSHPVFRPYTQALGQIALAWNGLHSAMALLFCIVMGGGYANQFLAIWHALTNDAAQRDILQAAAKDSFGYDSQLGAKV